jgi:hypothetical protein
MSARFGLTFIKTGGHIIYLMKVSPETGGNIIYLMKVSPETGEKYHLPDEG